MAFLEDARLLAIKIVITVIIYAVPVSIVTGGLLLTKQLLGGTTPQAPQTTVAPTTTSPKTD